MSKNAAPIPLQTPIVDNMRLTIVWERFLKYLADDWVAANRVITKPESFNYTINGSIVFFAFTGTTETTIDLPYIVGVDSVISGIVVLKGTKTITLSTPTSGFYFAQL